MKSPTLSLLFTVSTLLKSSVSVPTAQPSSPPCPIEWEKFNCLSCEFNEQARRFDINCNNANFAPTGLPQLTPQARIRSLKLGFNRLTDIPADYFEGAEVEILDVMSNDLTNLRFLDNIAPFLRRLLLSDNQRLGPNLEGMPQLWLSSLQILNALHINNIRLSSLNWLQNISNAHTVTEIFCSDNNFSSATLDQVLLGFTQLNRLEMDSSGVQNTKFLSESALTSLAHLKLKYNSINRFIARDTMLLESIEEIDLFGNMITTLSRTTLANIAVTLRLLNLERNQIICDCRLSWYPAWQENHPDLTVEFDSGLMSCTYLTNLDAVDTCETGSVSNTPILFDPTSSPLMTSPTFSLMPSTEPNPADLSDTVLMIIAVVAAVVVLGVVIAVVVVIVRNKRNKQNNSSQSEQPNQPPPDEYTGYSSTGDVIVQDGLYTLPGISGEDFKPGMRPHHVTPNRKVRKTDRSNIPLPEIPTTPDYIDVLPTESHQVEGCEQPMAGSGNSENKTEYYTHLKGESEPGTYTKPAGERDHQYTHLQNSSQRRDASYIEPEAVSNVNIVRDASYLEPRHISSANITRDGSYLVPVSANNS